MKAVLTWVRRNATNVVTALAMVAAIAVGTMAAQRMNGEAPLPKPKPVPNWSELAAAGTRLGAPVGKVRIVEFGDYQCPSCARAAVVLDEALASETHTAISYIHFPLTAIHPAAFDAAVAAECGAAQGRFAEIRRTLFQHVASMQKPDWRGWAREAKVSDLEAFEACLGADRVRQRVQAHAALAMKLGVQGTPAFVVDGELLPLGTPIEEVLERIK